MAQVFNDQIINGANVLFFDMDGTLTKSQSQIEAEMEKLVISLIESGRDVIVVSGQTYPRIRKQVGGKLLAGRIYALAQNGNNLQDKGGVTIWNNTLTAENKAEISKHINSIRENFRDIFEGTDENDLVQDRGCQIAFSLLGHNADLSRKRRFDPDGSRRQEILKRFPLISSRVEVKIGGTTTFDYFEKDKNKGANVRQMIEKMNWKPEDCVYVGDALFEGGNDESVKDIIDTHEVNSPEDTISFINKQLTK